MGCVWVGFALVGWLGPGKVMFLCSKGWGFAAQVSKADLLDFPELPSVPVDTPVGGNTPHDDDDDIGTHFMQ